MRISPTCSFLPFLYIGIALDFHLVLIQDSANYPEKYSPYFAEFYTVVVWATIIVSSSFFLLSYITLPGYVRSEAALEDPDAKKCSKCNKLKVPLSHHCSQCRNCVLGMDHHCIYIANCVGLKNRKFFVLFLTYTTPGGLMYLYLLCQYLFGRVAGEKLPSLIPSFLLKCVFAFTALSQIILISLVALLAIIHWFLLAKSVTTIDVIPLLLEQRNVVLCCLPPSDYDLGYVGNVKRVFGETLWQWGLPLPPVFNGADEDVPLAVGQLQPELDYVIVGKAKEGGDHQA